MMAIDEIPDTFLVRENERTVSILTLPQRYKMFLNGHPSSPAIWIWFVLHKLCSYQQFDQNILITITRIFWSMLYQPPVFHWRTYSQWSPVFLPDHTNEQSIEYDHNYDHHDDDPDSEDFPWSDDPDWSYEIDSNEEDEPMDPSSIQDDEWTYV